MFFTGHDAHPHEDFGCAHVLRFSTARCYRCCCHGPLEPKAPPDVLELASEHLCNAAATVLLCRTWNQSYLAPFLYLLTSA